MDISILKNHAGKPLVENSGSRPIYLWMAPLIADLSEDDFWGWFNKFYEVGPTESQVDELRKLTDPENTQEQNLYPQWKLWCAMDKIWQNHIPEWKSRGYNPDVTGGWFWRQERERLLKIQKEIENQNEESQD